MAVVHFRFFGSQGDDDLSTFFEGIVKVEMASRGRLPIDSDTFHIGRCSFWDDFLNGLGIEVYDRDVGADAKVWVVDCVSGDER